MKHHTFVTFQGFETIIVGFTLALIQSQLRDDPHSPIMHLLHSVGSPYWASVMIFIGIFATIIGLSNMHKTWIYAMAFGLLAFIWGIYTVAFIAQSIDFDHIDLTTIFFTFNCCGIAIQAYCGSNGGGGNG